MADIVNIVAQLQREILGSGITVRLEGDRIHFEGPMGSAPLRMVELYRPSSDDVRRAAAPDALLVLTSASRKAASAASQVNHILAPEGAYRVVAPGIAVVREPVLVRPAPARKVRLMGRTGVVAETLLLGGSRQWSIRELAADAKVSPALAHRVAARLEHEGLLTAQGHGPEKGRILNNARALAELWSQEEIAPKRILRGFLYSASMEALAWKLLSACPGSAVGGTLAANSYKPVLTRITPPIRIWAPHDFVPERVADLGLEQTDSGANVEFVQSIDDPWRVHVNVDGLPRVSKWRSWLDITNVEGRTQALADALLSELDSA